MPDQMIGKHRYTKDRRFWCALCEGYIQKGGRPHPQYEPQKYEPLHAALIPQVSPLTKGRL